MRIYLNDSWRFYENFEDTDALGKGEHVRLPHTVKLLPYNCFNSSEYERLSCYTAELDLELKEKRRFLLTFEGAAHKSELFVNGKYVKSHSCGYTAFTADITNYVTDGINKLRLKLDSRETLDQPPFGNTIDYMTYGGLYREAYLDVKDGVYVDDCFIKALPDQPVELETSFGNFTSSDKYLVSISDADGVEIFAEEFPLSAVIEHIKIKINSLKLWSVDSPYLYGLKITVGTDVYKTRFGVRSAVFKKDGFYLNGKRLKIVGLNRHQCYPYVGYSMPKSMQEFDVNVLKNELALNAVRTSHYPQSKHFLNKCDEVGLMVFTEIPGWQHIGGEEWKKQALQNVEDMILQYKNHPSVILWGVRINESQDDDGLYSETNRIAHVLDSTRQTGGVRYLQNSHLLEDVYTYNDFNDFGAGEVNKACPNKNAPYLITEYNGHMYPTKAFDDEAHRREHMLRYARMLEGVFKNERISGAFGWCMSDYNTHCDFGSGDKICYHGVTDMFRNPKYAASVFKAQGKDDFLCFGFSADIGDYAGGVTGERYVLTNADEVRFYRGGKYLKTYTHKNSPFKNLPNPPILIDDLIGDLLITDDGISPKYSSLLKRAVAEVKKSGPTQIRFSTKMLILKIMLGTKLSFARLTDLFMKYEGNWGGRVTEIKAEAYRNGIKVAEKSVGESDAVRLDIKCSATELTEANTYDVAAIRIAAVDGFGNVLPYINKVLTFKAEGAVELVGPELFAMQGGFAGTYVKTVGKTGVGYLYVDGQRIVFNVNKK